MNSPSLLTPWTLEPLQTLPTAIVATLYLKRTRTLAAGGRPVPAWKQTFFWTGIALTVLALDSPVDSLGQEHFTSGRRPRSTRCTGTRPSGGSRRSTISTSAAS